MSIIVDLHHRQIGAALARRIERDEPDAALACGGGKTAAEGAEILLFPSPKRAEVERRRKPLKRRFAIRAQRAAQE